ncbi:MAG TPA: hypothetical protein PLP95_11210, partial [Microthrixaceae bacterium]|nr:hypothetical protein [Microthrixaceae bacterium]
AGPVPSETGPPGVIAHAQRSVSGADKAAAELKDQIVITLGKVTDVGSKAGSMLQAKMELRALRSADPATLSGQITRSIELLIALGRNVRQLDGTGSVDGWGQVEMASFVDHQRSILESNGWSDPFGTT